MINPISLLKYFFPSPKPAIKTPSPKPAIKTPPTYDRAYTYEDRAKELIDIALKSSTRTLPAIFYSGTSPYGNERTNWKELFDPEFRNLTLTLSGPLIVWKFLPPCRLDPDWMATALRPRT